MGNEINSKLNQLLLNWPAGTVYTSTGFVSQGYNYDLINKYKQNKWISQIGQGSYIRYGTKAEWTGGLYAIQTQLKLNIHAGGKTALYLKGYAQFISQKKYPVFLFGSRGVKLPSWFKKHNWGVPVSLTTTNLFPYDLNKGFSKHDEQNFSITISSPERAMMEMLYHVPKKVSFKEAFLIMENLTSLRHTFVNELLAACSSIKVKRLFLFMAEKHNYPWFNNLNISDIYLGKGKRIVEKNGILDKKYLITVPKDTIEIIQ